MYSLHAFPGLVLLHAANCLRLARSLASVVQLGLIECVLAVLLARELHTAATMVDNVHGYIFQQHSPSLCQPITLKLREKKHVFVNIDITLLF